MGSHQQRVRTAAGGYKACLGNAAIIVCGGYRPNAFHSSPEVIRRYMSNDHPEVADTSIILSAECNYTAKDMTALTTWLKGHPNYSEVIIYAHPDHGKFAKMTLQSMGVNLPFSTLDSGEKPPYSELELVVLNWVYARDPKWEHWQS